MAWHAGILVNSSFSKNDWLRDLHLPIVEQHLLTNLGPRARFVLPGVLRGDGAICLCAQALPQLRISDQARQLARVLGLITWRREQSILTVADNLCDLPQA